MSTEFGMRCLFIVNYLFFPLFFIPIRKILTQHEVSAMLAAVLNARTRNEICALS